MAPFPYFPIAQLRKGASLRGGGLWKDTYTWGTRGVWVSGYPGCLGVWVSGYPGCLGVWVSGYPGCLGVWVSGCLGVWVSGCLGVWVRAEFKYNFIT